MRKTFLFPLLSGLLMTSVVACGDDSSSDDAADDDGRDDDAAEAGVDDSDDDDSDDADDDSDDDDADDDSDDDADDDADDDSDDDADDDSDDDADDDSTDVDGGADDAAGDGGSMTGDGGDVTGDGGDMTGDGGDMTSDGGDSGPVVEAAPPLPEGACADSPANPENGSYADCSPTLNGGKCLLTCDEDNFVGGSATCVDGEWDVAECVRLGSLTAEIGDAATGEIIDDAVVYVEGFYDPETEDCDASDFCRVSGDDGLVRFDDFPSGEQRVVIVSDGYDPIALPISIEPGSEQTVHLDALPEGFLAGNIAVVLGWEVGGNLDLVVNVPAETDECIYFDSTGDLEAEPFAQLDRDARSSSSLGPETIRIKLNDGEAGPYYDDTYSILVSVGNSTDLQTTKPSVRVIRAGANGGADVDLFRLPTDAMDAATEWHVADLDGDGSLTVVGTTESITGSKASSDLVCIPEL